jgi:hypothetical protein
MRIRAGRSGGPSYPNNARGDHILDIERVGDPDDLPLGSPDSAVLAWAAREGRVLVSGDRKTMVAEHKARLTAGTASAGVFLIGPLSPLPEIVEFLVLAAYCTDSNDWIDRVEFIPPD